jgi:hypothetical protein
MSSALRSCVRLQAMLLTLPVVTSHALMKEATMMDDAQHCWQNACEAKWNLDIAGRSAILGPPQSRLKMTRLGGVKDQTVRASVTPELPIKADVLASERCHVQSSGIALHS